MFGADASKKYGFYLLDINVPKINGLEICKKIRSHDALTPIIILSAYDDIDDKRKHFSVPQMII
ncbi:response regulator [Sphingobacterium sp. E70]|uniref:response regulator n=1 Tax=Sphingobacterium sp. E70 TaxID=2853439 RepID=UPI00359C296D